MFMTNEELWQKTLEEIRFEVSTANFITWFQHTIITEQKDQAITVGVPNAFVKEWIESKYQKPILKIIRNFVPDVRSVEFSILPKLSQKQQPASLVKKQQPQEQQEISELSIDKETNLNPRYSFDNFIVGSFNELAYAASQAIVNNLGAVYNPFFIYGGVGLGKTHLLQAVGNEIRRKNPHTKIKYISSEKFTNEFITAVQNKETNYFKERYRMIDLLIIDDIQFISKKVQTQEEIFHTFNTLYENNKQIILSSDRPPKLIENLEERLRSRFEGGMIADISEPEYEARLAILHTKRKEKDLTIADDVLEYIAASIKSNIRELEGALNLIAVRLKLQKSPLSINEVKEILSKHIQPRKVVTAKQIIRAVSKFYNTQEKFLIEKTRRKDIVKPRQIAMYLLREDFNGSYPYIGQKLGGRDHTTAIHSYEKISRDIKKDKQLQEEIKQIRLNFYYNQE
ncbi:MAG: chromosomal replication initiator protein DnaA [Candidatus Niyogibacteria bacterium CG10_big_fil_rev_8_21_14_0_10_46_36]|uniref:Chromosomal replication initiator protein DnaA n=1 Tax=Candidatus Niyogibacteria bacterium CG10_big_fil_rev_8_21_14_0_10_46_36 TaxID=1974726 RepID=A0A2H0TDG2_9BACT|nr:MAG: chromosomal replication initiator protein DnaA [Candidatus Niyogibacteria bacterium CG10_big_fil_rev_8_21_14_0_10_46_36]